MGTSDHEQLLRSQMNGTHDTRALVERMIFSPAGTATVIAAGTAAACVSTDKMKRVRGGEISGRASINFDINTFWVWSMKVRTESCSIVKKQTPGRTILSSYSLLGINNLPLCMVTVGNMIGRGK
jgi:hypothetical protein